MSQMSFEDLQVRELDSSQTTVGGHPEEALAALLALPNVHPLLHPFGAETDAKSSHDAKVAAWLLHAEDAMQRPGASRREYLLHEALSPAPDVFQRAREPPSRICTPLMICMSIACALAALWMLSSRQEGVIEMSLLSAQVDGNATGTILGEDGASRVTVADAVGDLTRVLTALVDGMAYSPRPVIHQSGGSDVCLTSFTMADVGFAAVICVVGLALAHLFATISEPKQASRAPRKQSTPKRSASSAVTHRALASARTGAALKASCTTPPPSPLAPKKASHVGTQTPPPPPLVMDMPQACGVRRSSRILLKRLSSHGAW
jgi:hypothetical protein